MTTRRLVFLLCGSFPRCTGAEATLDSLQCQDVSKLAELFVLVTFMTTSSAVAEGIGWGACLDL